LKLPIDLLFEPLHDVNDKVTDKLFTSFVSMSNDNGKALTIFGSAMIIYSKMSLHGFGSGSTSCSCIWRNNLKNYRSQRKSYIFVIIPNSSLINDTNMIVTSRVGIASIVSLSIYNLISIYPLSGAKVNEQNWALLGYFFRLAETSMGSSTVRDSPH